MAMDDFDQYCSWAMKPNAFMDQYQARTLGSYEILDKTDEVENIENKKNGSETVDSRDERTLCRIRSFKRTHNGVVNQGDRVKACSLPPLHLSGRSKSFTKGEKPFNFQVMEKPSLNSPEEPISVNLTSSVHKEECQLDEKANYITKFEIFVIGKNGVGKTSLCEQFLTSDSCALYTNMDSNGRNIQQVTVDLDDIEWTLIFHDYEDPKRIDNEEKLPDAYIIVYSIDDNDSFDSCSQIAKSITDSAVFIVGNKSDLERLRQVQTEKGRRLAEIYDGQFFEVSTILNHMVDNLLVQIIMEIRRHFEKTQKGKCARSKYSLRYKKSSAGDMLMNFFRRLSKVF